MPGEFRRSVSREGMYSSLRPSDGRGQSRQRGSRILIYSLIAIGLSVTIALTVLLVFLVPISVSIGS